MDEAILKLIVDMGPESAGALQFYVIAELLAELLSSLGWVAFLYLVYVLASKLIQITMYDPGAPIRKVTHPSITGSVSEGEINDIVKVIEVWKVKAEQFDKQIERQNSCKDSFS